MELKYWKFVVIVFGFVGVLLLAKAEDATTSNIAEYETPEITVFGKPNSGKTSVGDYVPTVSVMGGKKLNRKKQQTLGETLSHEAGVSSSFFGPSASRPVIRGLDGERIRILQNGIGTMDASGTSPDHSVSLDPFLVDQVEVVRGSAALLYGNSAVGGVVNTVNQRIPNRQAIVPLLKSEIRGSSVDGGSSAGILTNMDIGKFTTHFDLLGRRFSDYHVPTPQKKIQNSANETVDGAVGGSYFFKNGYIGLSASSFGTEYGTVAEPNVKIDLDRKRFDLAGEAKGLGFLESTRFKSAYSYYKHQEIDAGTVATTFRNKGTENRIDFKHRPVGNIEGVFGLQQQYFDFSAVGDEAFLPPTQNASYAFFAHEEWKLDSWTPSIGFRVDRSSVRSLNHSSFGSGESRQFTVGNLSAGLIRKLDPVYSVALNASLSERSPNYQEIFANGPHVATHAFEIGDKGLKKEFVRSLEVSLRQKNGSTSEGRVSVFVQDYSRFIALINTGTPSVDDPELIEHAYRPVRARIYGAELEQRFRLPWSIGNGFMEIELKLDGLRGKNLSANESLPRMSPIRETIAMEYRTDRWEGQLEFQHHERQSKVSSNETPTPSYLWVNAGLDVPVRFGKSNVNLFAHGQNLFDVEAKNHVSFLKEQAPLPGRNIIAGFQIQI